MQKFCCGIASNASLLPHCVFVCFRRAIFPRPNPTLLFLARMRLHSITIGIPFSRVVMPSKRGVCAYATDAYNVAVRVYNIVAVAILIRMDSSGALVWLCYKEPFRSFNWANGADRRMAREPRRRTWPFWNKDNKKRRTKPICYCISGALIYIQTLVQHTFVAFSMGRTYNCCFLSLSIYKYTSWNVKLIINAFSSV